MSNGFEEFGEGSSRVRSIVNPVVAPTGVRDRELVGGPAISGDFNPPPPSPKRTRVSIDFSKFPLRPFRTAVFLFSSLNPISRSF